MTEPQSTRAPMHLWIVGILSLLWNAIGGLDYTMTQTRNMAYLKGIGGMTDQQIAYFDTLPAWVTAIWALGVWGAIAGSILLLMRRRSAVAAFLVSLLGLIASTVWQYNSKTIPPEFKSSAAMGFTAFLWVVAIGLLLYARAMRARNVLR